MKVKPIEINNISELADALGLTQTEGAEIEFRVNLNNKIIDVVKRKGLTHAQVAKLAKTSRPRVTAILNRNIMDVSTDLMLRILSVLGYVAKVKYQKVS